MTAKFDRSVGSFAITTAPPDPHEPYTSIAFSAEDDGGAPVFGVVIEENNPPDKLAEGHNDDLVLFPNGTLYLTRMSAGAPSEIWSYSLTDAKPTQVTHMNDALLSQIDMRPIESFTFKGANNEDVQGFLIKPPGFEPAKRYPLKFLIPRRAAGRMGKFLVVSLEPGVVRGQRLCRGHDQFPRLDRLWAEVYRLDQRRLGRQTVYRSDEGAGLRGEDVSVHR